MSTALVHDYLLVMRGAERTFAAMADAWPSADVYTLVYDPHGTQYRFSGHNVTASYLQHLGLRQHNFRRALPLFPRAAESLPVQEHDVVISSSSAFAHGVKIAPDAVHVCYCHSPFRYAWHERDRGASEVPKAMRPVMMRVLDRVRAWDERAAKAVTRYVANSQMTRTRIQEFYDRDCNVIHPPVDVDRFSIGEPQDYALIVTEIVRHKRVELALEAARRAGQRVKVVGTGPDLTVLKEQFAGTAEFLGRVPDCELDGLYAGARMFIMANVEEFGIAAVEAQAAGRPVVAAAAGGALETVVPGETGVLVKPDDVEAMAEALRYTDFDGFSPDVIQRNASRFSAGAFKARMQAEVDDAVGRVRPAVDLVPAAA
jgi:glycosyltransferase involved in cell wall biosynthesis